MTAVMAEMYGKASGCSGGRGGSMHIFDAETNLYGGNAIVGGGLPLAVGLALADRMRGETPRHRLLLRRRRGGRGRVPRDDEPCRALGAAGALRLREQRLRHGLGAGPLRVRDRHPRQGGGLRHGGRGRRRHGRGRRRGRGPPRGRRDPRATAAAVPRMPDLPLPGAFDVRRPALPRQGRGRGLARTRARSCASRAGSWRTT